MIEVALLGVGGTLPLPGRYLSSVLMRYSGHLILIDCGEGTQVSLRRLGWGLKEIGHIFISHFHADHVAGIPGLLLTIGNSGRGENEPVILHGPRGLTRVVESLRVIAPRLPFPVIYKEYQEDSPEPWQVAELQVRAIRGDHDMYCLGYRFDLPRLPEFNPQKARNLGIPITSWKVLQKGGTVQVGDTTFYPEDVLGEPRPGLSVGFITDSRPCARFVPFFQQVDLLICEGTYGDSADQDKAIENKHMTFAESARLAKDAQAKRLWLTHFSPAMPNPDFYLPNAQAIFPEVQLGKVHDGWTMTFRSGSHSSE